MVCKQKLMFCNLRSILPSDASIILKTFWSSLTKDAASSPVLKSGSVIISNKPIPVVLLNIKQTK